MEPATELVIFLMFMNSRYLENNKINLEAGMVISNEPDIMENKLTELKT